MDRQQYSHDAGQRHAMQNVKAGERILPDDRSPQQHVPQVIVHPHSQQFVERSLMPDKRRGRGHVGSHGNGPVRKLIPRQQITRETQRQCQHQQDHAETPVEFPWRPVGSGVEDPHHVQDADHDHCMSRPAMHVSQKQTEGNRIPQVFHIAVGTVHVRNIIEHQQSAGQRQNHKQQKRDSPHPPGVGNLQGMPRNRDGVQVQKKITDDYQGTVAGSVGRAVTKNRPPELRPADPFPQIAKPQGLSFHHMHKGRLVPVFRTVFPHGFVHDQLPVCTNGKCQPI